jgi:hypothetical protein
MKKEILIAAMTLGLQGIAHATAFNWAPDPSDLWDLDHRYYYKWIINDSGLAGLVPESESIVSATLTFNSIRNWQDESDILKVYLVDYTGVSARTRAISDNESLSTAYLSGLTYTTIGSWSDDVGPYGQGATGTTEIFTFNSSQLTALNSYAADGNFGFIIDPDCHYFNEGVDFQVTTRPKTVPDGGSSAGLLVLGLLAMGCANRKQAE